MMYGYMTLPDDTGIAHSEMKPDGSVKVNATKIWLTQSGKTIPANRHTEIPAVELRKLLRVIEANADLIREKRLEYFGELRYYC